MAPMVELINGWIPPVVLSPFIGSFLGVVIERLPQRRPIALGRSVCAACEHALGPADLVPLLSFTARRGRCRHCRAPIPRFHLWIELAAIAVSLSAALAVPQDTQSLWAGCLLGWTLLALAWIDAETWCLPDVLTLPLILAGLLATAWLDRDDLTDHALAAALGYSAFRLLNAGYRRLRGRDGLGEGDAKLLAASGAWVGSAALPFAVLAAALGGLAWAGILHLRGTRLTGGLKLPFGPFLALGSWLAWLAL